MKTHIMQSHSRVGVARVCTNLQPHLPELLTFFNSLIVDNVSVFATKNSSNVLYIETSYTYNAFTPILKVKHIFKTYYFLYKTRNTYMVNVGLTYTPSHLTTLALHIHLHISQRWPYIYTFTSHNVGLTYTPSHLTTLALHIHLHISQHVNIARYTKMFIYGLLVFDTYKHRESNHGSKYTTTRSLFPVHFMSNFKNSLALYNASEYRF